MEVKHMICKLMCEACNKHSISDGFEPCIDCGTSECEKCFGDFADHLIANGVTITPAVPGPSEDASNNKDMYFKCGMRHMKAMVLAMLQDILYQEDGLCLIDLSEVIKAVEDLSDGESKQVPSGSGYAGGFVMGDCINCRNVSGTMFDALENIVWYNGHYEWLKELRDDLSTRKEFENYTCPIDVSEWYTDKHAIWMLLVGMFGDWGTSIRSGWIEKHKECVSFIDALCENSWKHQYDS